MHVQGRLHLFNIIHQTLPVLPPLVVDPVHGLPLDTVTKIDQTVSSGNVKVTHGFDGSPEGRPQI